MKKHYILFSTLIGLVFTVSCSQKQTMEYTQNQCVAYTLLKQGQGDSVRLGDKITVNVIGYAQTLNGSDSMLVNTYEDKNPLQLVVQKPLFCGDIMEGFTLLRQGDSALFSVSIDSVYLLTEGGEMPEYVMPNSQFKYAVRVENIVAKAALEQKAQEEIDAYIKNKHFEKAPSGLYYQITKKGSGKTIQMGDTVLISYTGMTLNGVVFDSTDDYDTPLMLVVSNDELVTGWVDALLMMKKGEKAQIILPPSLGYDEQSIENIPPYTPLRFDIEVLEVKSKK